MSSIIVLTPLLDLLVLFSGHHIILSQPINLFHIKKGDKWDHYFVQRYVWVSMVIMVKSRFLFFFGVGLSTAG